jgi:hypothetical protein
MLDQFGGERHRGTAPVLAAFRDLDKMNTDPAHRGVAWLLGCQGRAAGWGGAARGHRGSGE